MKADRRGFIVTILSVFAGFRFGKPTIVDVPRRINEAVEQVYLGAESKYVFDGVRGGMDSLLTPMDYLTRFLGFTEEQAALILRQSVERANGESWIDS